MHVTARESIKEVLKLDGLLVVTTCKSDRCPYVMMASPLGQGYSKQVHEKHEITEAIPLAARASVPPVGIGADPPASDGLSALGGMEDPGLSPAGGSPFLVLARFSLVLLRDGEAAATS
jgi:hypothetical protein